MTHTDKLDLILTLHAYKNKCRVMANDFATKGVEKDAQRYRDMSEWFAEAIKREEALPKEES